LTPNFRRRCTTLLHGFQATATRVGDCWAVVSKWIEDAQRDSRHNRKKLHFSWIGNAVL